MTSEVGTSQDDLDLRALEDFWVGNEDLDRLEAFLDRFNIFEVIGMAHQELRHSQFLAYLLKLKLILRDDPNRMNYAGDVAKDGEQDIDPELLAYPHL
jgi:hypothetical protein